MTLTLYAHPFSSYCQKVLIALYEGDIDFIYRMLGAEDAGAMDDLRALWPIGKFPLLVDEGQPWAESSIILEHLDRRFGLKLLPDDADEALKVRFLDRFFDNHVMTPMQRAVGEALRPDGRPEAGVKEAGQALDVAYGWLEEELAGREWATGEAFTLADCAAAPSLFYADWVRPIGETFPTVQAYRRRLLDRSSFRRCVEEARPYRPLFPLGAPDRD